uniref:Cysteine-rich transmembrane CYSTM domain-containing protein n=1 Tax=Kalanchoe fedtschenkoi TaxID=63787 RepID=A0A7N0T4E6_KALFE
MGQQANYDQPYPPAPQAQYNPQEAPPAIGVPKYIAPELVLRGPTPTKVKLGLLEGFFTGLCCCCCIDGGCCCCNPSVSF